MLPKPIKIQNCCKRVADYLRAREANLLRGKPEFLESLDNTSDLDLLKKWSWMSSIVGTLGCLGAMLILVVVHSMLPSLLMQLFWTVEKIALAAVCLMFALAVYFTFFISTDSNTGA